MSEAVHVEPLPGRTHPGQSAGKDTRYGVLIVDDDESFSRMVGDLLADSDIEAVAVRSATAALGLAASRRFSVAVVDLIMPEMDGLELARRLRRASPSTEVVLLTGHADLPTAIEAVRNEIFDFLQKEQLHSLRLRRAVRAAIARSELKADNQKLLAGLQRVTHRLEILAEASGRLAAERHLDRLVAEILRSARELVEAERVRVVLAERSQDGDVVIRACYGDGELAPGTHFGSGTGILTATLETGVPVLLDSPSEHPRYSPRCDDMGAQLPGFLCAPMLQPGLTGVLMAAGRPRAFAAEDLSLLASLARHGAVAIANAQLAEDNANFFTHVCDMLVSLLDAEDPHYQGHARAVAAITDMITRRLGLPHDERRNLHFAALLHDVGKLRLRESAVRSGDGLTGADLDCIHEHPALGVEIVRPISRLREIAPAIHSHHERWDGKGYPRGLAGQEIPLGGRIIAVAEAYEAMTRPLPDRTPRRPEDALREIEDGAGSQFDPKVVRMFISEFRRNAERLLNEPGAPISDMRT